MDSTGVLRVGGRIGYSDLTFNQKFQIILPQKNHLTDLIISEFRLELKHGGTQLMLASIRNKYWILKVCNQIRKQIHQCITCFRQKRKTYQQLMAPCMPSRLHCMPTSFP